MSRTWRYRKDEPGDVQYVTVKGVGGLPVFALRSDVRFFLSLLAREVRAGELAVYCFAFMRNHAHFLVLSPRGAVHLPLKRILGSFARHYNRTRGRVGHVFKDRFHSSRVTSESYFLCCVIYTDHNPVKAKLARLSTEYEFGSAFHCVRPRAPRWLSRHRVTAYVPGSDRRSGQAPEASYLRSFGRGDMEFIEALIARRSQAGQGSDDPLDVFFSPDRMGRIEWIRSQAELADGTAGARLLAKPTILKELVETRAGRRTWRKRDASSSSCPWRTLLVGLLRLGCAITCREVGRMLDISATTVYRETERHLERLSSHAYVLAAEEILSLALRRTFSFLPPFPRAAPDGTSEWEVEDL